jgi:hypothetical protein
MPNRVCTMACRSGRPINRITSFPREFKDGSDGVFPCFLTDLNTKGSNIGDSYRFENGIEIEGSHRPLSGQDSEGLDHTSSLWDENYKHHSHKCHGY